MLTDIEWPLDRLLRALEVPISGDTSRLDDIQTALKNHLKQ